MVYWALNSILKFFNNCGYYWAPKRPNLYPYPIPWLKIKTIDKPIKKN